MYGYGNVPKNLFSGDDASTFAATAKHQHDAAAASDSCGAMCDVVQHIAL